MSALAQDFSVLPTVSVRRGGRVEVVEIAAYGDLGDLFRVLDRQEEDEGEEVILEGFDLVAVKEGIRH